MRKRKGFGNVKSLTIYPKVSDKMTVGIKLCRLDAICFAKNILSAALVCNEIDITGFRCSGKVTISGR